MFPIGHVGLAAGAAWLIEIGISKYGTNVQIQPELEYGAVNNTTVGKIDYRMVIIGSLLPDIVDKPLWFLSQGGLFPSGRSYAHTFLFSLILLVGGLILLKFRKSWLLTLSLSSFSHLILDKMWQVPATLWWPFAGELLRVTDTTGWFAGMIQPLITRPDHYTLALLGEALGFIFILILMFRVIRAKGVVSFIKTGFIP